MTESRGPDMITGCTFRGGLIRKADENNPIWLTQASTQMAICAEETLCKFGIPWFVGFCSNSSSLDLRVTINASETTNAPVERNTQQTEKIFFPAPDFLMIPSLVHAYCVEKTTTAATATPSNTLAVLANPVSEDCIVDSVMASIIFKIVFAVTEEHANTPRSERLTLRGSSMVHTNPNDERLKGMQKVPAYCSTGPETDDGSS